MSTTNLASDPHTPTYRSGVAARLAGVPVETLRVWERRYKVVGPSMSSSGQRLYSSAEIRRLALIKQLVDMGHPIGSIATMSTDALIAMRSATKTLEAPRDASVVAARASRVVLVGPLLSSRQFENTLHDSALIVVERYVNLTDATNPARRVDADILVTEFPILNEASQEAIASVKNACGATQVIVLYRFAPSAVIRRLRLAGYEVARAPSDSVETEALCRALLRIPSIESKLAASIPVSLAGNPAPPRFAEQELIALTNASNTVYCECPRHLVELLLSMSAFERYSAECANRGPDDAALHLDLQHAAGHARVILEDAFLRVAIAEGLTVPKSPDEQAA
ncbi:MerR family transcriptional regulator [Undibacterium sp. Jales W-56]|uniref:MerR family transcriptional regulator n=1 Tax=Undibacterium sp. Jales W-56 TaxID=2897325 RepID=UPI0021D21CFF|nr:MerR family transcriptional regulator [Undibacterium sp. Jales W-56]MCU6433994.1 MerR family transcriptional regulator [Undibacterium sp. Jales W-56]